MPHSDKRNSTKCQNNTEFCELQLYPRVSLWVVHHTAQGPNPASYLRKNTLSSIHKGIGLPDHHPTWVSHHQPPFLHPARTQPLPEGGPACAASLNWFWPRIVMLITYDNVQSQHWRMNSLTWGQVLWAQVLSSKPSWNWRDYTPALPILCIVNASWLEHGHSCGRLKHSEAARRDRPHWNGNTVDCTHVRVGADIDIHHVFCFDFNIIRNCPHNAVPHLMHWSLVQSTSAWRDRTQGWYMYNFAC